MKLQVVEEIEVGGLVVAEPGDMLRLRWDDGYLDVLKSDGKLRYMVGLDESVFLNIIAHDRRVRPAPPRPGPTGNTSGRPRLVVE